MSKEEQQTTEYELAHFSEDELRERNKRKAQEDRMNRAYSDRDLNSNIQSDITSYHCEGLREYRIILSLNEKLNRSHAQHIDYAIKGMSSSILQGVPADVLAENGLVSGEETTIAKRVAYIKIKPEDYFSDDSHTTIEEALSNLVQPYYLQGNDESKVLVRVFIETPNLTDYNIAKNAVVKVLKNIEIISTFPKEDIRNKGYVEIKEMPTTSVSTILTNFYGAFNLLSQRRQHIFINTGMSTSKDQLSVMDLQLIAQSKLMNFVIEDDKRSSLAEHFTKYWLFNHDIKYVSERLIDFFNAPKMVLVKGVSYIWGVITGRVAIADCVKLSDDGTEDEEVPIQFSSARGIESVVDHATLTKYLGNSIKNKRDRLIKFEGQVYRVKHIRQTITVRGKLEMVAAGSKTSGPTVVEVSDMSKIVFLTDYYDLNGHYNRGKEQVNIGKALLPENINSYMLRRIVSGGGTLVKTNNYLDNEDLGWFEPRNNELDATLERLDKDFSLKSVLKHSISASTGLSTTKIIMKWEDLKCLQTP